MHTRPIRADEIDSFAAAGCDPSHEQDVKEYLEAMFTAGAMHPEWCYITEEEGEIQGRVALWTLPKSQEPSDLVLLDIAWDSERSLAIAQHVLSEALRAAHALGASKVGHVIDAPPMWPQWQRYPQRRMEALALAGFALQRETRRFELQSPATIPSSSDRLVFRSLEEVGDAVFLDAIVRVSQETLDRAVKDDFERDGPEEAARALFEELHHERSWYELAYAPSGELVGLVMPARNPTSAVINYIGVLPEHRGHRYIDDLLARGTATLVEAGAERIRADTDTRNAPMAAAFRRAGYAEFARRREYAANL